VVIFRRKVDQGPSATKLHSRPFAKAVSNELIVRPPMSDHMVQNLPRPHVISEIEES